MHGLPEQLPTDGRPAFTGLVCPDCSGNLVVSTQGEMVFFSCRVGHAYGVAEVVLAKEAALETVLWRAVFAFEELEALLADLSRHRLPWFGADSSFTREKGAREQATRLRAIIETDRPLAEHAPGDGEIRAEPS